MNIKIDKIYCTILIYSINIRFLYFLNCPTFLSMQFQTPITTANASFVRWKTVLCLSGALLFTACGGGSDAPSVATSSIEINLTTSQPEILAGAPSISISANVVGSSSPIRWNLDGNLGSLSSNTGNKVEYTPPPLGTVETPSNIKITAEIGSVSKSITLMLRPSASGAYPYTGAIRGWGYIEGLGNAARFALPTDIVADADDNLYVWDQGNQRIRKLSKSGAVSTFATISKPSPSLNVWLKLRHFSGRFMYANDAEQARLISQDGHQAAIDSSDLAMIADYRDIDGNTYHRTSNAYPKSLSSIVKNQQVLAGNGPATIAKDGKGSDASFVAISNLVVFPNKIIYVLDQELASGKYQLRQITQEGVVTTLSTAKFESPARIIVNSGTLPMVLDGNGIHKLQTGGSWGFTPINNGSLIPAKNTEFDAPDATADKDGNIYLADPTKDRIVRISAQGNFSILAGMLDGQERGMRLDGSISVARFLHPYAMSKDRLGNLYVIEETPNAIDTYGQSWKQYALTLRKISPDGVVTTLSAPGIWWGKSDSTKLAETFTSPSKIIVDNESNIWIFNRVLMLGSPYVQATPFGENAIWKITPEGKPSRITTRIIDCTTGANSWQVCDIAFDGKDLLVIADGAGVHKLAADGSMSKLTGMEAFGPVSAMSFDSKGNLYFAGDTIKDPGVYKRSANGTIEKLHSASAYLHNKILADDQGNLYSSYACSLVKISATGTETVIAGINNQCGIQLGNLQNVRLQQIASFLWLGPNAIYAAVDDAILKIVFPQ